MFATYYNTKFHMLSYTGSTIVSIKQKCKYRFCVVAVLLFEHDFNKNSIFSLQEM
jgi:hypothetical protein